MKDQIVPGYVRIPPTTTIQVRVPHTLRAQLEAYAKAQGMDLSKYIRELLKDHVRPKRGD